MNRAFKLIKIFLLCAGTLAGVVLFTSASARAERTPDPAVPEYFLLDEKGVQTYKIEVSDIITNTGDDGGNPQSWRIDKDKLNKRLLLTLSGIQRTYPEDAYIDPETMKVVPEKEGNKLSVKAVLNLITSNISENSFKAALDERYYLHPEVRSGDPIIIRTLKSFSYLTGRSIDVNVTDRLREVISPEMLEKWITYDGSRFVFDNEAINEYADSLSGKYTTSGTLRSFTTYYGSVVQVGNGYYDNYNGWVADFEANRKAISDAVRGKTESSQLKWSERGYTLGENGDDIGGTYLEISIDNQHLLFFKDHKKIMETDIVSGTETNPERATVRGLFHVLQMKSPYVMHGSYGSQPCDYFIRITWMGHAMHDAPWQASFGGTRYLYSGSHGCINMPYWAVSQLWSELCKLDDWQVPIIIY